jgi:Flp pilus assembly protein TadD
MISIQHALAQAWEHFQAGRLPQAEQLFQHVVEADPKQADAWHFLGLIAGQTGQDRRALECLTAALRLRPDDAEVHNNLGNVFILQRELPQAVAAFRQAVRCKPDHAVAHNNLGSALRELGHLEEAVRALRQAVLLRPDYAVAHSNMGIALQAQGKLEEAVASNQQALRLRPEDAEARNNLEAALAERQRLAEATPRSEPARCLDPALAADLLGRGASFLKQERPEEALALYQQAVRVDPDAAAAHLGLGRALMKLGRPGEAVTSFRESVRIDPSNAEAHNNLGIALGKEGRLVEAAARFRQALRCMPDNAEAHNNLGITLALQGRLEEAAANYQQALRCMPDFAEAHHHLAMTWLLQGDLERGWPEYEWRWKCGGVSTPAFRQPIWDGSNLQGRAIFLHEEQGLGDTLQFIRYARLVKARGATVYVGCGESLMPLLGTCAGIDRLTSSDADLPPFDFHAPLLSLPRILGTTLATVPADIPYLFADERLVTDWRRALSPVGALKVGIAWQGNPNYIGDRQRSIPLAQFAPLARLEGVQLFSLQKGPGTEQLRQGAAGFPVTDLGDRLDESSGAFVDTAALMKALDLVITSDSAVAHLAGALGVPVWVALPVAPDWRWLLHRGDSPWYPTMRLFRQTEPGRWQAVFERMAREVGKLSAAGGETAR